MIHSQIVQLVLDNCLYKGMSVFKHWDLKVIKVKAAMCFSEQIS